jgi:ribosomal protein S6
MEKNDYLKQKLLEKKEKIDNNLLRFLTVRVKKFDLNKNYFRQEN